MSGLLTAPSTAYGAIGACVLAVAIGVYLLVGPRPVRVPLARRRPGVAPEAGPWAGAATAATGAVERAMRRRGARLGALELAGVRMRPQDFVFLVGIAAVVTGAVGLLLVGPLLGLLLAGLTPVGAKVCLRVLTSRRQRAFADQLDDSLQLMSSSLRAGHSLPQALDSVAREAEAPTSEEFSRVINEMRVGRDLTDALDETSARVDSKDFLWVAQAIAINREVGGNLAEVLDGVGHTIRERNQIRRQVKALGAEGKLSAIILMLLPVGITGFLSLTNPEYIGKFTQSLMGWALVVIAVILLVVGGIWLAKTVKIKF